MAPHWVTGIFAYQASTGPVALEKRKIVRMGFDTEALPAKLFEDQAGRTVPTIERAYIDVKPRAIQLEIGEQQKILAVFTVEGLWNCARHGFPQLRGHRPQRQ